MKKLYPLVLAIMALVLNACQESVASQVETITVEQMSDALNAEEIQLLDVRTTEEYFEGHLENATNICVTDDDFKEKVANLDRDKPIYVYCKKGGRSARAAKILKEMGFKKIYDMSGGMDSWKEAGLETEKEQS